METVEESLFRQFEQWRELQQDLEAIVTSTPPASSRLMTDNRELATESTSFAHARYVFERGLNTVRTLKKLDYLVFRLSPGEMHLDQTTMYPLMRSVLEDMTTVTWMLSPDSTNERLCRSLRIFHTEVGYFITNQQLLGEVAFTFDQDHGSTTTGLKEHLESERSQFVELIEQTAERLGIDKSQVKKSVGNRTPIADQTGDKNTQLLAWKLLSDMSHFSYLTMKLSNQPAPDYDGSPLNQVNMIFLAAEVGRSIHVAVQALRASTI